MQAREYCPYGCGKSTLWGQKANLYPHIRLKHSNERLQCTLCHYKTHDNFAMSRHWTRNHKGIAKPRWPAPIMPLPIQIPPPTLQLPPLAATSSRCSLSLSNISVVCFLAIIGSRIISSYGFLLLRPLLFFGGDLIFLLWLS
ncbi:hypothetical protein DL96DRAFT_1613660 [Flagelloscypha sp. PMI_526]|nr:hypothetical protein DL96DRAFT_1613660 [Flagelloscypha sp. PMI_526]